MTTLNDLINDYTLEVIEITQDEDYDAVKSKYTLDDARDELIQDIKNLILRIIE